MVANGGKRPTQRGTRRKWDEDLDSKPNYSPASFWMAAKEAGYDGCAAIRQVGGKQIQGVELVSGIHCSDRRRKFPSQRSVIAAHVEVRSRAFQHFVRLRNLESAGELVSAEILTAVVETMDAECRRHQASPVHLRVARHGDKGYLFLGDDARTVVEYDASGFRECTEPPVRFRRRQAQSRCPCRWREDRDFRPLFNLDDENWVLLLSWMVMTLVHPGRPTPICVLNGEHGSAKTTALKQVVAMLDPKVGATAGPPKTEDDLIASAYSSAFVSFDNVSSFFSLSDPLCRLATGGGLRKRQLFTDNSLAAYDVIRPVIVSGIDPTAYNLDIVERLLTIELSRPEVYLTEEDVTARFEAALPAVSRRTVDACRQIIAKLPDRRFGKATAHGGFCQGW